MNLLYRRPGRVLFLYWAASLALAGTLLWSDTPGNTPSPARTVTLLTGQSIGLTDNGSLLPASGVFEANTPEFGAVAIPDSARSAVGTFFDAHLFEPAYLEAQGFGDDRTSTVPLLVSFATREDALAAARGGLIEGGIHITHVFEYLPLASGYVEKGGPFVAATGHAPSTQDVVSAQEAVDMPDGSGPADADEVTGLYLDDRVSLPASDASSRSNAIGPSLNDAIKIIGADVARAHGLTGQGVSIAVVDTGIDSTHPDLQGRVRAVKNFSTDSDTLDHFGHGTHVASIAAGTGAASDGKYGGVAPAASLISAKALNRNGGGTEGGIIQAMEWAADQGAKVINMSLGGGASAGKDPMSRAVNAITAKKGVLFAIAAGNSGPRVKVSTPAAADASLAVAAIDKSRELAPFSSRGPRLDDMALKPDISAPGVSITAARANYGSGDPYATYSGTSMATPMVAGSAALVFQLHPDWSQQQVKDALLSSATPIGTSCSVSAFDQGAGAVNLAAIVEQKAVFNPGSASFGTVPKSGAGKLLTLTNFSKTTLNLTMKASACSTAAAITVSPATVSLAPGQTAQLTVSLGEQKTAGTYFGDVVALSGSQTLAHAAVGFVVK